VSPDSWKALIWEWMPLLRERDRANREGQARGELRLLQFDLEQGRQMTLWHGPTPFCPTLLNTDVDADLRVAHVGNDVDRSFSPRSAVYIWDALELREPSVQATGWVGGVGAQPRWRPQGDAIAYMLKAWQQSGPEGPVRLMLLPVPRPAIPTQERAVPPRDSSVSDFAWSPDGRQLYVSYASESKHGIAVVQYPALRTEEFALPGEAFFLRAAHDSGDLVFAIYPSSSEHAGDHESPAADIWRLSPAGRPERAMSVPHRWLHAMSLSPDGTLIALVPRQSKMPSDTGLGVSVFGLADGLGHRLREFEDVPVASADWVSEGRALLVLGDNRMWLLDRANIVRGAARKRGRV
jgi:hypothetical protein